MERLVNAIEWKRERFSGVGVLAACTMPSPLQQAAAGQLPGWALPASSTYLLLLRFIEFGLCVRFYDRLSDGAGPRHFDAALTDEAAARRM